jgi:electron transport complex protein RnfC
MLDATGGICPITTCSKALLNGPCGGSHDGRCEVHPEKDCGWHLIYQRLQRTGRLRDFMKPQPLRDYSRMDFPMEKKQTLYWALEREEEPQGRGPE